MPIYEYRCPRCGERFEQFVHRSADGDHVSCPHCGESEARKQISQIAAITQNSEGGMAHCAPTGG